MQEELFYKYLHSIGQQLGAMFSEEAAGTVQDAFFRNLAIKPTGMISLNKEILKKDEEKKGIVDTLKSMAQTPDDPYETAKRARALKIKSLPINMGTDITVSKDNQRVPVFGNEQQKAEGYPAYSLTGAEYAPIVDRFVSRITGKPTGIVEMMQNAMTNVKNIPLALFYGENIPINNMKDLLNYALYNKAKEYNPTTYLPGYKIVSNSNIKNVSNAYENKGGGSSSNNGNFTPGNAVASSEGSMVELPFNYTQNSKNKNMFDISNVRLYKVTVRDKKTGETYVFYNDYKNDTRIKYYDKNGNFIKDNNVPNGFSGKLADAFLDKNKEIIDKREEAFTEGYATSGIVNYNKFNDLGVLATMVRSDNVTNDDRSGVIRKIQLDANVDKDFVKTNEKRRREEYLKETGDYLLSLISSGAGLSNTVQDGIDETIKRKLDGVQDQTLISLADKGAIGGYNSKKLATQLRSFNERTDIYYQVKAKLIDQLIEDSKLR